MRTPLGAGGFADIWKGKYNDQVVAAKVLRVYSTSDIEEIKQVGFIQCFTLANELIVSCAAVL
jgi:hypothetical protein